MEEIVLCVVAIIHGLFMWVSGGDVKVQDYSPPTKSAHVQHDDHPVLSMSDQEFAKFVASQNPHDPTKPTADTAIKYPPGFKLDSTSSSTSGENAILSGNAVFNGQSGDTGSTDVTNTSTPPVGYHLVKGYTTSKGTYVAPHYAKNSSSNTSSSSSTSSTNWSTPTFTHSYDVQQRSQISQQNFPNAKISSSDPTIIIGTH